MKMLRLWEILSKFKSMCKSHGWKTCENEDWVKAKDGFHNFLSTREVHPSSFNHVVSERKCVVRDGVEYHTADVSYTAWLFSQTPSETLVKQVLKNQDLKDRTALYDLSLCLQGERTCPRLNNTDSRVFQEFENYLRQELNVKFAPILPAFRTRIKRTNDEITQFA